MAISLSGLFIYPVKSLRGLPLEQAVVSDGRLAGDREWLLLDERGQFMHQRDYPQLARLRPVPTANGLVVETAGHRALSVARPAAGSPVEYVRIWRRLAPLHPTTAEAGAWFTSVLGMPVRLMSFAFGAQSRETPDPEARSSLQDATPFHITCEASLDDLNGRIGWPIPMSRFRPNLVLAGAPAFAEDAWRDVRIGTRTVFHRVRPCTRCKMTMTDQETGERPSLEPLRTLATYRRLDSEVAFGHYFTATGDGPLRVGDTAAVLAVDG